MSSGEIDSFAFFNLKLHQIACPRHHRTGQQWPGDVPLQLERAKSPGCIPFHKSPRGRYCQSQEWRQSESAVTPTDDVDDYSHKRERSYFVLYESGSAKLKQMRGDNHNWTPSRGFGDVVASSLAHSWPRPQLRKTIRDDCLKGQKGRQIQRVYYKSLLFITPICDTHYGHQPRNYPGVSSASSWKLSGTVRKLGSFFVRNFRVAAPLGGTIGVHLVLLTA